MACRRPGDKPLSEAMMVSLQKRIFVTWPQWVNFLLIVWIQYWRSRIQWWCIGLPLTHWGRVTHICVGKLTIIASDNGLSPGRRQAIIWNNAGILLIEPLGTNFSDILIGIQMFSFRKMRLKMSSAKWRPFCIGLNVLSTNGDFKIFWRFESHSYICMTFTFAYLCHSRRHIILNYLRSPVLKILHVKKKTYRSFSVITKNMLLSWTSEPSVFYQRVTITIAITETTELRR